MQPVSPLASGLDNNEGHRDSVASGMCAVTSACRGKHALKENKIEFSILGDSLSFVYAYQVANCTQLECLEELSVCCPFCHCLLKAQLQFTTICGVTGF